MTSGPLAHALSRAESSQSTHSCLTLDSKALITVYYLVSNCPFLFLIKKSPTLCILNE